MTARHAPRIPVATIMRIASNRYSEIPEIQKFSERSNVMWHYCNSCGEWAFLDRYTAMCRGCADTWTDNRGRTVSEQIERLIAW